MRYLAKFVERATWLLHFFLFGPMEPVKSKPTPRVHPRHPAKDRQFPYDFTYLELRDAFNKATARWSESFDQLGAIEMEGNEIVMSMAVREMVRREQVAAEMGIRDFGL